MLLPLAYWDPASVGSNSVRLDLALGVLQDSLGLRAAAVVSIQDGQSMVLGRAGEELEYDLQALALKLSRSGEEKEAILPDPAMPGGMPAALLIVPVPAPALEQSDTVLCVIRCGSAAWTEAERQAVRAAGRRFTEVIRAPLRIHGPIKRSREQEHYTRLVQSSPYGIFVLDDGGYFREVNPALCQMVGRDEQDLLDSPFIKIVAPVDRSRCATYFQACLNGREGAHDYEALLELPTGEVRTAHIRTTPITEEGVVTGVHGVIRDVTMERQSQTALRTVQQRLNVALEGIGDAYVSIDHDLRVTHATGRAAGLLGRALKDLIGEPLPRYLPPELAREIPDICRRAVTTQRARRLAPFVHSWNRWIEARVFPAGDELSIFFSDITERKAAEVERQRREQEFRALVENSPDVIVRHDLDLRVIYQNPTAERELGTTPAGSEQSESENEIPEGVRATWVRALESVRTTGEHEWIDLTLRVDGDLRHYDCRITPERNAAGEIVSLLSVGRDTTKRKRAERMLRESEARFRGLVEQPLVGIYIFSGGRLEYVNPHTAEVFGYSPQELIAAGGLHSVIVPEDLPLLDEMLESSASHTGGGGRYSLQAVRRDGEKVMVETRVTATVIDGEPCLIGMLLDVTEQIRTETELRERGEQLRHAQKLEAVGQLAGGVAHDFNNLLMVIQGTVNLMLMDLPAHDPSQANLKEILRATERASSLTRQLLAFSRKQVLRPKVLNLNRALEDLHKMMSRTIGEDIELIIHQDVELGCVRVDPGQLEQVVLNLVINARDAMPTGGRLIIETANAQLSSADARRFPYRVVPGPYVRLSIVDAGTGMDSETLARIFEPFFTTKEQGKGTGLGLSMVYGIVKQSGGYIWTSSIPGEGTRMDIFLPYVEQAAETETAPIRRSIPRGTGTILLVEDEEPVRSISRRILQRSGYEVIEAGGGPVALQRARDYPGEIHLLITDVVMPEMDGRELATRLLGERPNTQVLYMSGYAQERLSQRGISHLTNEVLQKPFAPSQLVDRVQSLLTPAVMDPPRP